MKRVGLIFLLFVLIVSLLGYDSRLGFEQPVLYMQNFQRLFGLSGNPVLFARWFGSSKYFFKVGGFRTTNDFKRLYDPTEVRSYSLVYDNLKCLSAKNLVATSVSYHRSDLFNQYRSLEKSFYDNYFSIIDTTTGNFTYDGPVLAFLDVFSPLKHLYIGFLVNYGVERGLKDVFTKCETIARNFDVSGGAGIKLERVFVSVYGRYLNNQRKYEAVKEYQDANVSTFYGFNILRVESPRTKVRKNYFSEGYEFGGHCEFVAGDGSKLEISCSGGSRYFDIEVGSPSRPLKRGYWVRSGKVVDILLRKQLLEQVGFEVYWRYSSFEDWAESSEYHVVVLENSESNRFLGLGVSITPGERLFFSIKFGTGLRDVDYVEYNSKFSFSDRLGRKEALILTRYDLNRISRLKFEGRVLQFEPYFYWDCSRMNGYSIKIGFERLTIWGYSGVDLHYREASPVEADKNIKSVGVEFILAK